MTSCAREHVRVTFAPEGRSVFVMTGTSLIEAAGRAGIVLNTPCGGRGTCGNCRVEITLNAPAPSDADRQHLSEDEIESGMRLACQVRVTDEMRVDVPVATRFFDQKILTDGEGKPVELDPSVRKHHMVLPPPSLEDQRSDTDRVHSMIEEDVVVSNVDVLHDMPGLLRASDFDVTAVVAEGRLVNVEPGDTTGRNFGMAFDIGTTTVVGFLMDLVSGREASVASRTNPQIKLGDDVVNRIQHASQASEGLEELRQLILDCMNEIIEECCSAAKVSSQEIYEVTLVGNTTMNHLFLGINPEFVAQAPYVAALRRPVNILARDAGLRIHPRGLVHTLPNIAGFVGADTVGVILSSDMHRSEGITFTIDIGTNGELVIGNRDRLVACSTAAGPAFEGARIRFGMRAADGAIDKAIINDDLEFNVIGNVLPRGLCGTALIDLVAELLRVGCIDPMGRLLPPDEMPSSTPDAIKRRIVEGENKSLSFLIAPEGNTQVNGPIVLTQRDVRELQLGKGAISAGVSILLKEIGVEPKGLDRVLLAGAFGNFIRRKMAKRIGLLPEVPTDKIFYIGNAAGAGARMALLSRNCKHVADRISKDTEYLELAGRADFQQEFMSAMLFPES